MLYLSVLMMDTEQTVTQLVETLRYKPQGSGFDYR